MLSRVNDHVELGVSKAGFGASKPCRRSWTGSPLICPIGAPPKAADELKRSRERMDDRGATMTDGLNCSGRRGCWLSILPREFGGLWRLLLVREAGELDYWIRRQLFIGSVSAFPNEQSRLRSTQRHIEVVMKGYRCLSALFFVVEAHVATTWPDCSISWEMKRKANRSGGRSSSCLTLQLRLFQGYLR